MHRFCLSVLVGLILCMGLAKDVYAQAAALPDIAVQQMSWASHPVYEGTPFWISIIIYNAGTVAAGASYAKAYLSTDNNFDLSNDYYLGEKAVDALAAGGMQILQWDFDFPNIGSGTYPVWAVIVVDSRNQVAESDENNTKKAGASFSAKDSMPEIHVIPTSMVITRPAAPLRTNTTWIDYVPPSGGQTPAEPVIHRTGLIVPDSVVAYWKTHAPQSRHTLNESVTSIDWSAYDSPVKNQLDCGSCWAFAAIALIENLGSQSDLSEQVIISCAVGDCRGGWYGDALNYAKSAGVPPESCLPYLATNTDCSWKCSQPPFLERVTTVNNKMWGEDPTVNDMKAALQNGPIVVHMGIPSDGSFDGYRGGVYNYHGINSMRGYHAVEVVGYNDAQQCFKVKNSWGTNWGEGGYFRIAYDVSDYIQFGDFASSISGVYTQDLTNSIAIENVGTLPLSVKSIANDRNWLGTTPSAPLTIQPRTTEYVTVGVDWNLIAGAQDVGMVAISSNDPDEPVVSVQVTAIKSVQYPEITLSASSLPDFGSVEIGKTAASQSYTVSGTNLTANITITAPSGFLVSKNNLNFGTSITLGQTGGTVPATTVYVKFYPQEEKIYSGTITHASAGANSPTLSVSGTGLPNLTASSIQITSVGSATIPPSYSKGTEFWVEVKVGDPITVTDLYGINFTLQSDNGSCTYVDGSAAAMDFLGVSPLVFFQKVDDRSVDIAITKTSGPGINGSGFVAKAKFVTPVTLSANTVVTFSLIAVSATNPSGGSVVLKPEKLEVKITYGISVWPGDCDDNGIVSGADVLRIGLYYARQWQNYPTPNNPGMEWKEYLREHWTNDPVPEKIIYSDATGDGIVDAKDVLPVGLNYGKIHAVSAPVIDPIAMSKNAGEHNRVNIRSVKTDKGELDVCLFGEFTSSVYGLSLRLNNHFERGGARLSKNTVLATSDTSGSIFGQSIHFVKQTEPDYTTDVALSRINGEGIRGAGKIITLRYHLPGDWEKTDQLIIDADNIAANDSCGSAISIEVAGFHGMVEDENQRIVPLDVVLEQNYPNPFNPSTVIRYALPQPALVRLEIFDILGRKVTTLFNESQSEGYHSVEWDIRKGAPSFLSSGVYTYRLTVVNSVSHVQSIMSKRMIVNK